MRFSSNQLLRRTVALPALVLAVCSGREQVRAAGPGSWQDCGPAETLPEFPATPEGLAEKIGVDGLEQWPFPLMRPPPLLPPARWYLFVPDIPPEPTFFDRLELKPVKRVSVRPTGVPWFLPGELGTSKSGDLPGPGFGLSLNWRPSNQWRFGADLIMRAERVDADNRLHDWTPYIAPGVEFIPYPNAPRPFSIGLVTPWALYPHGDDWSGLFVFIRWNELLNKPPQAGSDDLRYSAGMR